MVIGPSEAGKSTLIRSLSDRALNIDYRGRTVAMDHAVLKRGDAVISLVGVPGEPRFEPVRQALSQGASCAVWVHPATSAPDPFTIELLRTSEELLPYLVVVNQRNESSSGITFDAPPILAPPRKIISGNLVEQADFTATVEDAIWGLIHE